MKQGKLEIPKRPKFVSLAGNIGSGKTTAAKIIQQNFGYELFEEPVVDNRFLKEYYKDMKRWSLTLQFEFLIKRFKHHQLIGEIKKPSIQDRSLIEDPEVFVKYLNSLGNLNDKEVALYQDFFNTFNEKITQPNLIIYLKNENMDKLLYHIHEKRGRKEEKGIGKEFLEGLNNQYRTFPLTAEKKYNIPVYTVDCSKIDIKDSIEQKIFIKNLESVLR